jgi:hypothetical protein
VRRKLIIELILQSNLQELLCIIALYHFAFHHKLGCSYPFGIVPCISTTDFFGGED